MKNDVNISIPRIEDASAVKKRMEDYALARDLQAQEYNQAIIRRLSIENRNIARCSKCGKEFQIIKEGSRICPSCISRI